MEQQLKEKSIKFTFSVVLLKPKKCLATAMNGKRGVRNRWVEVLPAEAVSFIGISPSGAIAAGRVWESAIISFAASYEGFVECIRVREKTCPSKHSETTFGIRLKSVAR
ncbi:MAG: hypothetical protein WBB28_06605 [Crinalium sp.]